MQGLSTWGLIRIIYALVGKLHLSQNVLCPVYCSCVSGTVCSFIAKCFLFVVLVGCRGARSLCGRDSCEQYNKETGSSKENFAEILFLSNIYWTVHHCNSWRIKDQLDITCYFISLLMCSTCFWHCASACNMGATQNPATPNLQHTTNWEQEDRCGNSATQSQAPDDGYINVRNMFST